MNTLAEKQCVPCKGGVPPLKGQELARLARELDAGWQVLEEDSLPRAFVRWAEDDEMLRPGDFLVSTAQIQSLLITILLEPESMWGLTKYDAFSFLLKQRQYPILRVP